MAKRGAGVPRWVEVTPERIEGWVASFAERHGVTTAEPGPDIVVFRAADGAVAECHAPFPPLRGLPPDRDPVGLARVMAAHAAADRTVAVLLVRLGGYAAGV